MSGNTFELGTNPAPAGAAQESNGTNPAAGAAAAGVPGSQDQGIPGQSDAELNLDGEDSGQQPTEPDDELDDIEHEGKKARIPKWVKPLVMFQADYTQKTQEHADRVRSDEAKIAQDRRDLRLVAHVQQQHMQQRGAIAAIDQQLSQYGGVNWQQAMATDPQGAQAAWMQFQQLKDQRTLAAQNLQVSEHQLAQHLQQQAQQAQTRALDGVRAVVSKWSPEVTTAVNDIGSKAYGIGQAQFEVFAAHPALLNVLHDAVMYRQLMGKAAPSAAKKPGPAAAPALVPVEPLPQGGGQATPKRLDSPNLSVDEWMKRRNEQLARRQKR